MLTYQDLIACISEEQKQDFILKAIYAHKDSDEYKTAYDAEQYYKQVNVTITNYQKIIYDLVGRRHNDPISPNHKIATNFFKFAVTQENNYLLGNGVKFSNKATKKKLGKRFDKKLYDAGKNALVQGVAFCFWNLDHIEVFKFTEFVPFKDEETGALRAGIRFWQVAPNKPLRATLYEEDGYTEYIKYYGEKDKEGFIILKPKRPYKVNVVATPDEIISITDGGNYPSFPIIPLYANDVHQSEIVGKRATIDALDLLTSGLVNNVDEASVVYWVIQNAGGMNDWEDVKFIERLKTLHVAHTEDDGATATPHTVEAPYQASDTAIGIIKQRLYEDFMAFNVSDISSGNKTATEINARYQLLDSKTDGYEYEVLDFIDSLLELVGIEDEATFTRSKVVNISEAIQNILQCADYIDRETIIVEILNLLGLGDRADDILKKLIEEEADRYLTEKENQPEEDEETEDEVE